MCVSSRQWRGESRPASWDSTNRGSHCGGDLPHASQTGSFVAERLDEVIQGARFERCDGVPIVCGDENRQWYELRRKASKHAKSVQTWHLNVQQRQLGPNGADKLHRLGTLFAHPDESYLRSRRQEILKPNPGGFLVVDDDRRDGFHCQAGW